MAYKVILEGTEVKREGQAVLASDQTVQIKQIDEKERKLTAIASTEVEDRDKDVIRTTGWKLDNYTKNPVGLWSHDYRQLPIFKAVSISKDTVAKTLVFTAQFADHDRAKDTFNAYAGGFLNAFSVGFIGLKVAPRDPQDPWWSGQEFTEQELLEISGVSVPANPEALVQLRSMNLVTGNEDNSSAFIAQLGLLPEAGLTKNGHLFIPIADLAAYSGLNSMVLGNGISVISGNKKNVSPDDDGKTNVISQPVGYLFDPTKISAKEAQTWLTKSIPAKEKTSFFFEIKDSSDDEDKPFEMVSVDEKQIVEVPSEQDMIDFFADAAEQKFFEEDLELELDDDGNEEKSDDPPANGNEEKSDDPPADDPEDDDHKEEKLINISKVILNVTVLDKSGNPIKTTSKVHDFEANVSEAYDLEKLVKELLQENQEQKVLDLFDEIKSSLDAMSNKLLVDTSDEKDKTDNTPGSDDDPDDSLIEFSDDLLSTSLNKSSDNTKTVDFLDMSKEQAKEAINNALEGVIGGLFAEAMKNMNE